MAEYVATRRLLLTSHITSPRHKPLIHPNSSAATHRIQHFGSASTKRAEGCMEIQTTNVATFPELVSCERVDDIGMAVLSLVRLRRRLEGHKFNGRDESGILKSCVLGNWGRLCRLLAHLNTSNGCVLQQLIAEMERI